MAILSPSLFFRSVILALGITLRLCGVPLLANIQSMLFIEIEIWASSNSSFSLAVLLDLYS